MQVIRSALREPRVPMLGAFGVLSVTNYGLSLFLGRVLSPGDYGLVAFAQTIGLVVNLVLTLGLPPSLTASIVLVDGQERAALVRGAVLVNLGVGVLLALGILILFLSGPLRPGLETIAVTAVLVAGFPFMAFSAVAQGGLQGSNRFGLSAGINVVEVVTKAAVGTSLVVLGAGAVGVVIGITGSFVVGAVLGGYYITHSLRVGWPGEVVPPRTKAALALFMAQVGLIILLNLDLLAVKIFAANGRVLTGYYQAGTILANAPYFLSGAALIPVLFTRVARTREIREARHDVNQVLRVFAVLVLPFEVPLILFPRLALSIFFPSAYGPGADALRLLAIGNAVLIPAAILGTVFQATGRPRIPAIIFLSVVVLEAVALRVVVGRAQIVGAASVFVIAAALCLSGLLSAYARHIRAEDVEAGARWLARYALAVGTAALVGACAWRVTFNPVVSLAAGGTVYLGVVVALGLLGWNLVTALRPTRVSATPAGHLEDDRAETV